MPPESDMNGTSAKYPIVGDGEECEREQIECLDMKVIQCSRSGENLGSRQQTKTRRQHP